MSGGGILCLEEEFYIWRRNSISGGGIICLEEELYVWRRKSESFEMAEKSGFETLKTGSALLKKETFAEKVEQRAVIKFCMDISVHI
jgi:hypothetical protein